MKPKISVVVVNWNNKKLTEQCIKSLQKQHVDLKIILIDNGSADGSVEYLQKQFPNIRLIAQKKNLGFAGGANVGIKNALKGDANYIALLNNDVVVDKSWLQSLVNAMEEDDSIGAVTGKLLNKKGDRVDNTGDEYSVWGLTIPRDRGIKIDKLNRDDGKVFGACAGAALYRAEVFKNIGLFDEKFFAYYEDSDLNFRMQLAGWETKYQPSAVAYHDIGSTSKKISGFTTLQTIKNQPMLFWKNVPLGLLPTMFPKFFLAHSMVILSSIFKGHLFITVKGVLLCFKNTPHYFLERRRIQKRRKVSNEYIWSVLYQDLPPDARRLRRFRAFFTGKK
ncbi:MAG TPA: glycosyltransferase family 2 protein [Candidatus Saccharimonadales bacterium]|nr:glycosyltransferase family 2 protein [Candidatus Saccharimonadales bacterium]